ncbi:MAG: EamA family transporter [bacterium]|nr:EamA family transporter [bacterium]
MTVLFALLSTMAYSMQSTLLAGYYRQFDNRLVVFLRNSALVVFMLPVLLFVPESDLTFSKVPFSLLCLSCVSGFVGMLLFARALHDLPVGIVAAFNMSALTISTFTLEAFFTGEIPRFFQMFFALLVVWFSISLCLSRAELARLLDGITFLKSVGEDSSIDKNQSGLPEGSVSVAGRAYLLAAGSGILHGVTFFSFGIVSRKLNPLWASYLLESGVFLTAFLALLVSVRGSSKSIFSISLGNAFRVMAFGLPAIAGTVCFSLATVYGPIVIAAAVLAAQPVFSGMFAFIFYQERLSGRQFRALFGVCISIALLQVVSGL